MNGQLFFKKLHPAAKIPGYAKAHDSGMDVVCVEEIILRPNTPKLVRTGLAMELKGFPDGPFTQEIQVRPRSGLASKLGIGIVNSPGTVDFGYRGEISVPLIWNIDARHDPETAGFSIEHFPWPDHMPEGITVLKSKKDLHRNEIVVFPWLPREAVLRIAPGVRICQFVVCPVYRPTIKEVDTLSETDRGSGGFGSTGTKGS